MKNRHHLTLVTSTTATAQADSIPELTPLENLQIAIEVSRDELTAAISSLPQGQQAPLAEIWGQLNNALTVFENNVLLVAFRSGLAGFHGASPPPAT